MAKQREATTQPPASLEKRERQIAQRAYELHAARGFREGWDLEDWLEAERDVDATA